MSRLIISACTLLYIMMERKVSSTMIKISQGMIRGHDHDGYISYEGIPYASADIQQRFKWAGPPPSWSSIRESKETTCSLSSPPSECLQLDIHIPKMKTRLLPVFAWIKGGSGIYNATKFVEQGIIVVIISHRFGFEGFLCSDDERIPGNAGLKDVVMALRWVKENIVSFQGNPLHVVVGGQSFGAALVEALTLSPMAKNLYRGVIMQSGSVLTPWAFQYDASNKTIHLGRTLGDGDDGISNIINTTTKTLTEKATEKNFSYFSFGICAEKKFKNEAQFLSVAPYNLLSNDRREVVDHIPMLVGYNSDEANIFLPVLQSRRVQKKIVSNPLVLMPVELHVNDLTPIQQKRILDQLHKLYIERNISLSMKSLLAYHRDAYFLNHIHRSATLHKYLSVFPIYFYQFSYSKNKLLKKYGAGHSDELDYLFPKKNNNFTRLDVSVQKNIVELWSNFINYLDPTPDHSMPSWKPMDPGRLRVYDINHKLKMKQFPYKLQMQFWDDLYRKYYYKVYLTI